MSWAFTGLQSATAVWADGVFTASFPSIEASVPYLGSWVVFQPCCFPSSPSFTSLALKTVQFFFFFFNPDVQKQKSQNSCSVLNKWAAWLTTSMVSVWVHIAIVTGTQTPVLGVVPAGQSDWISSRKACCAAQWTHMLEPAFQYLLTTTWCHASYTTVTCSCLLHKKHCKQPMHFYNLMEVFSIMGDLLNSFHAQSSSALHTSIRILSRIWIFFKNVFTHIMQKNYQM